MRRKKLRATMALTLILGGGYAFMNNGLGCASFAGETVLGTVDFCFLFDCVDGAIGGLIQPCDEANDSFGNRVPRDPTTPGQAGRIFEDCP